MSSPDVAEEREATGSTRRLVRLLRPHRGAVATALGLGVAGIALNAAGPLLLGRVTDLIAAGVLGQASGVDFGAVGTLLAVLLAIYLASALFTLVQGRLVASVVWQVIHDLRRRAQAKLARLPLRYFDRHRAGEVLGRTTNDIDNLQQTMQQTLAELITSTLSLIAMLTLMIWISPSLAVVMLLSVPVSGLLAAWLARRAHPQFTAQWSANGQLNAHVEEVCTGHALIRGHHRREDAERLFDERNDAVHRTGAKAQTSSGAMEPVMMLVGNLGYVVVAVVGGWKVLDGTLTIGDVQAFILYARQFSQPIVEIASVAGRLQSGIASAQRVFTLLDVPEQAPDRPRPDTPSTTRGKIEFRGVSFRYVPDTPLIDNLSLTVEPGSTVAIVGPTGAGKTTLGNLLTRFYEVDSGAIYLDGTDIARMHRGDLRSRFGLVLQDTWLFGGTIADNIAYGAPDATRDDVVEAARATCVDAFVRTLPDGYDTVLDDDSAGASAGEKQLITVARAFLARPAVLVLDEATSSVDTRTEVLIQKAMSTLRAGRTSFVIAHRLSTIRDADMIVVMEAGRIVERGTHDELLAAGGTYARLHGAHLTATRPYEAPDVEMEPDEDPPDDDHPGPGLPDVRLHPTPRTDRMIVVAP
ncbi:ABC transporter ATP-binding protein [Pseudonocardia endophytica]|uniref:Fatty acid ABC transporter ATP-binding/permease protein n=1 Tax=Pseudonocardia endophytica TaxID=401976 RepID=A0A4R1HWV2_PSEEN|nr:ABC transporter ATP-binding protein [Pseudonocardia endophytica]TCK24509.1 ATP-binding cassette subfamily B protein [Pseudonocardia endophytica]